MHVLGDPGMDVPVNGPELGPNNSGLGEKNGTSRITIHIWGRLLMSFPKLSEIGLVVFQCCRAVNFGGRMAL